MIKLENLAKLRKQNKISQAEIADFLKIPQQQYSRYETGKYDMPLSYLVKICKEYNFSADYILEINNRKEGGEK